MKEYSDRFFSVDVKNNTLKINKKEAREIEEYRKILVRDRGGKIPGDAEGRKKELAKKELLYVYIMADPFNSYQVLSEEERKSTAIEITGLKYLNWKPDDLIKDAILRYREDVKLSPTGLSFINSKKSLKNIGEDIELIEGLNKEIRKEIKKIKDKLYATTDEEEKEKQTKKLNSKIKNLTDNNKEISSLIEKIPQINDIIDKIALKLAKENNEKRKALGGREIHNREIYEG